MRKLFYILPFLSLLLSCKEEEKPKVIYEESTLKETKKDSSQIKVADLPIHMEGTKYLLHPIGDVQVAYERGNYGSAKTNVGSYALSNYNSFELTGYFQNIKFQHIDSTALRPLTNKQMQIQTATYLNAIALKIKKQILIYSLVDTDTNRDGKMDSNDIKSLYISNLNGLNFQKLSGELQELIDWNVVEALSRLYFRTIEDINKNGAFDEKDKVHYHYVNLASEDWKVEDYSPVE